MSVIRIYQEDNTKGTPRQKVTTALAKNVVSPLSFAPFAVEQLAYILYTEHEAAFVWRCVQFGFSRLLCKIQNATIALQSMLSVPLYLIACCVRLCVISAYQKPKAEKIGQLLEERHQTTMH